MRVNYQIDCVLFKGTTLLVTAVNFPVDYLMLGFKSQSLYFLCFTGSFHFIDRVLWPSSQAGTSVR